MSRFCVSQNVADASFRIRKAADQRANGLGYWVRLMFGAIRVGFSGSLSTVSTFVAEACSSVSIGPSLVCVPCAQQCTSRSYKHHSPGLLGWG